MRDRYGFHASTIGHINSIGVTKNGEQFLSVNYSADDALDGETVLLVLDQLYMALDHALHGEGNTRVGRHLATLLRELEISTNTGAAA